MAAAYNFELHSESIRSVSDDEESVKNYDPETVLEGGSLL